MTDFLDEKRKEIDARLRELRPLVDEFNRLEKAAAALAGVGGGSAACAARRVADERTASAAQARPAAWQRQPRQAGAGAGSGTPGITISELADAMGIKANYLYRVMPTLEAEGQVKKRDKGWHPARPGQLA